VNVNPARPALLFSLLLLLFPPFSAAQVVAPPASGGNVKVFIDCVNVYCDFDFLRTEINFIDHVRDRRDADVHVLVTGESTGGGGQKYTVSFIGLGRYAGIDHLLNYVADPTSTGDETRRGLANVIKMGLIHYVAQTDVASEIQISRVPPKTAPKPAPVHDPWDYWFFRTGINASVNGEQLTNSKYVYGSVSANRVTDALKVTGSVSFSYRQSHYTFSDGSDYNNFSRSASAGVLVVKSLSPHWSAGGRISASRSTYLNQTLAFRVAPAVEYDLYPYSESTRRQLTFNYSIAANHFQYEEETIYDKRQESLASQVAVVSLNLKQPWGTTETSFEASQYLNAGGKNHLTLWNSLDIRLFKGLSFNTYGSVERLHDQIYLPKSGATQEEVLVQRRQLATSYSYYISFGISYSFGSIHNNVVNSRFTGI
jgi:hypothetical protein